MPYPQTYTGRKYAAPTICQVCNNPIQNEQIYNGHFTVQGACVVRGVQAGSESIQSYLERNFPRWLAQQKQATPVAKSLHWRGKIYPLGKCSVCAREKQVLSQGLVTTVATKRITWTQDSVCRLCIQTISDAMGAIASELTSAKAGGDPK